MCIKEKQNISLESFLRNSSTLDFGVLYGFLETNQTNKKKPAVWRNHTKAKGRKKPGQLIYFFLTLNAVLIEWHNDKSTIVDW